MKISDFDPLSQGMKVDHIIETVQRLIDNRIIKVTEMMRCELNEVVENHILPKNAEAQRYEPNDLERKHSYFYLLLEAHKAGHSVHEEMNDVISDMHKQYGYRT